jgi:HlyD family secretion protein
MMKKTLILIVITVIIASLWQFNKPIILSVETINITTGLTEATVVNTRAGTITACKRSKLGLAVGGKIAAINVKEGQKVKQGDALLNLWNNDLNANIDAAKANIIATDFEQQSLCIIAKSDRREAVRLNNLVTKGMSSKGQLDLAQAKANASKAACTAANARWQQSKAILEQAKAIFQKTYLTAPFDGTVAEISGEIGEFSTPSPPGVATPPAIDLLTTDCHYISAPIDEVDAGKIAIGMPVRITLDAFRGETFTGYVNRIAPYVQDYAKQARTVSIEINFDESQALPELLAGYSVDVEVILASSNNNLRLPTDSIIDNSFIYILNNQGVIEKRTIVTGLVNWQYTEVLKGLTKAEQVIVNANNVEGIKAGIRATSSTLKDVKHHE